MKTCNDCMFAFFVDYGYSNYTTEGTNFHCGVGKHPNGVFDRWFGKDKRLNHAEKCESFAAGKPVEMDCDRDNLEENTMNIAQFICWNERVDGYDGPVEDALQKYQDRDDDHD